MIQNQILDAQGEWSRFYRVPKETGSGQGIFIATLNIRSGRVGVLETALRALRQGNIKIRVLQEMKLTRGIHMRRSSGYTVWETEVESRHQGGIVIVWREADVWGVEGVRSFGPNVVSFIATSGQKRWYVVGAYVPPNDLPMIQWITQELACGP